MNSDEIRESFQLASNQFDMRAARLKRLYALNADNIISIQATLLSPPPVAIGFVPKMP